jgi:hypothetical protein
MWARCASDSMDAVLIGIEGVRSGHILVAALKFAIGGCVAVISGTLAYAAMKKARSTRADA